MTFAPNSLDFDLELFLVQVSTNMFNALDFGEGLHILTCAFVHAFIYIHKCICIYICIQCIYVWYLHIYMYTHVFWHNVNM